MHRALPNLILRLTLLLGSTTAIAATEPPPESATQLSWMSEEYPPINFSDAAGRPQGVAVAVLLELGRRLELPLTAEDIAILPWARAYKRLLHEPNTALFTMAYTAARERQFRFVGPLLPIRTVVLARQDRALTITDDRQLRQLRIGVVREDIGEQLLLERGFDRDELEHSNLAIHLVRLLARGRVDAIAYGYDAAIWHMRSSGIDPDAFEVIATLQAGQLGYAFHRDTDPALLRRLQQTLDSLRAEGVVDAIRARYLGAPPTTDSAAP